MEPQFEMTPYGRGWACFFGGGSKNDNPHPAGSADFHDWQQGYREAAAESYDEHHHSLNPEWLGDEQFCRTCGRKTGEQE